MASSPSADAHAGATAGDASGSPRGASPDGLPGLVFICGSGHSGSTLLEMLLAGHPEVTAVGELHNLSHQIAIGRPCSCGALPRSCARWQAVASAIRDRTGADLLEQPFAFRVSRERPRNALERMVRNWNRGLNYVHFRGGALARVGLPRLAVGGRTLAANTELVSSLLLAQTGARILVDSSKDYVRMRERYSAAHPGRVKVLYLCRDGRGVVWASKKYYGRGLAGPILKYCGRSVWYGSLEWAKTQRRIRVMLRGVRAQDRMDLRYEDLCADPEGTLRRICAWLGIGFSKAMLQLNPPEHHTIAGNKVRFKRAMTVQLDEEWRHRLTAGQLRLFDLLAGGENRRLGYTRP